MSAVVFLSGWAARESVFDAVREHLPTTHVAIASELPGYDEAPSEPYTLDALAAAVAAGAPARCTVVGWSLGGLIALTWARARPAQVERLILIATTPCFVRRAGWTCAMDPAAFDAFAASLVRDCTATLERFAALQALGESDVQRVTRDLRRALVPCGASAVTALARGLDVLRRADLRGSLEGVRQPALLVHGTRDHVVPISAAEHLAAALPHARLERIDAAAHAPFVSQPRRVAHAIVELIDAR
jgi:pimeloyl-[acyl-carrier protein] methyl ester esterase